MSSIVFCRHTVRAVLAVLIVALAACDVLDSGANTDTDQLIKLNQLGYLPKAKKIAIVPDLNDDEFKIISTTGNKVVFKGLLSESMQWPPANDDHFRRADFSSLSLPGRYYVLAGNGLKSD